MYSRDSWIEISLAVEAPYEKHKMCILDRLKASLQDFSLFEILIRHLLSSVIVE